MADEVKGAIEVVIDLGPAKYQSSIDRLRTILEIRSELGNESPLEIALKTPKQVFVELEMRPSDAYIVGFIGKKAGARHRYSFDDQQSKLGGEPCGIKANYVDLGQVNRVKYDDLNNLGAIAEFEKGQKVDKRLIAITCAVTSEAVRFAMVETLFTGLTNSVGSKYSEWLMRAGPTVDFEHLKAHYFHHWEHPPEEFLHGHILFPHSKGRQGDAGCRREETQLSREALQKAFRIGRYP